MVDIFDRILLILLLGAAIISAINVLMQVMKAKRIRNDFSFLISVFIVGWFLSEVLLLSGNESVDDISGYIHVIILGAFAVVLTVRYRWAIREAERPLKESVDAARPTSLSKVFDSNITLSQHSCSQTC